MKLHNFLMHMAILTSLDDDCIRGGGCLCRNGAGLCPFVLGEVVVV